MIFQLPFGIFLFLQEDNKEKYHIIPVYMYSCLSCDMLYHITLKLYHLAKKLRQRMDIPLGSTGGVDG